MTSATDLAPRRAPSMPPSGPPAFETFFEAWHVPLYRALWLVTRNRHEAEEIAQDAFLKVWERWAKVSGMERPEGYLFRTAMNQYRSRRRRTMAAVRRTLRVLPADDAMETVEQRDAIIRAMGSLTPAQRSAVVLTELIGMSSAEAAEALRVRPVTVRVLAARGRAVLKERMDRDDH
jgi:RNA polymerase sigma-70 factor, ECF subfamily